MNEVVRLIDQDGRPTGAGPLPPHRGAARRLPRTGARPPAQRPGRRPGPPGPARGVPVVARPGGLPGRRGPRRSAPRDWLFPTYRDTAAIVARGVDPVEVLVLLRGDWHCGYDPTAHRVAPQATPLATQLLHAVGVAHAARLKGEDTVVLALCGDGATSEGDFHEALNFAAVFAAPVVFLVQNNKYAISVPLHRQTAAPSLAAKGVGYGDAGRPRRRQRPGRTERRAVRRGSSGPATAPVRRWSRRTPTASRRTPTPTTPAATAPRTRSSGGGHGTRCSGCAAPCSPTRGR